MSESGKVKFVERRSGHKRRQEPDPCAALPVDLYHRKRRRSVDRRTPGRTLEQDIEAYYRALLSKAGEAEVH